MRGTVFLEVIPGEHIFGFGFRVQVMYQCPAEELNVHSDIYFEYEVHLQGAWCQFSGGGHSETQVSGCP